MSGDCAGHDPLKTTGSRCGSCGAGVLGRDEFVGKGGTKTWLGLYSEKGGEGVLVPWAKMWVGPLILHARGEVCGVSMLGSSGDPDTCAPWAIDEVISTCFGSSK